MGTSQEQGTMWGKEAWDWATIMEPNHSPLWEVLMDAACVGEGTRMLDIGCGGGGASLLAHERGARVSGLDAAQGMIDVAQKQVPDGDFRTGNMSALPYEDDAFDVVLAASSIQYAENPVAALREFARVCAPQGRIAAGLFGPPERVEYSKVMEAVRSLAPSPDEDGGPFGLSAPGKLPSLFSDAELSVLGEGEVDCPFTFADFDAYWRGMLSGGATQRVYRAVGGHKLRAVIEEVSAPYHRDDGSIVIRPNIYQYLIAEP